MQREQKHRILDRQRVQSLLQIRPERRPLRLKVDFEWLLMAEKVVGGDVVHRAFRRPEPREGRLEGPDDVLRRRDGDVALVRRAAE